MPEVRGYWLLGEVIIPTLFTYLQYLPYPGIENLGFATEATVILDYPTPLRAVSQARATPLKHCSGNTQPFLGSLRH